MQYYYIKNTGYKISNMYYYRLYDKQTKDYIHSGYNCRFAKDVKEELLSFLSPDLDDWEMDILRQLSLDEIASNNDYIVERSTTKYDAI